MKRMLMVALILLAPVVGSAQDERVQTSGSLTAGVQQVEIDKDSAHFGRFQDIQNGFYLYDLKLEGIDTKTGRFFDIRGQNISRDDQEINFSLGNFGVWRLDIDRNEIPNRLSDKAKTPYINQGKGLYTVPSVAPIREENPNGFSLVPTAGDMRGAQPLTTPFATEVLEWQGNDGIVSRWLVDNLRDVDLGTQRRKDSVGLSVSPLDFVKFRFTYTDERKDGSKITYGPIGDRPPRTLNIQMPEPIDYRTRELKAEADLAFDGIQGRLAYLFSNFQNDIDTFTWQNAFFSPNDGLDFAVTAQEQNAGPRRRVSEFGQRALAPDNNYHNLSGSIGIDLPMASRLTAAAAYGWMKQDKALLPYSYSSFINPNEPAELTRTVWNSVAVLPRQKADAEINTILFNLDYSINPVHGLNLRPFFRYYDLDNKTTSDQWRYVTQDVVGNAGTVGYRNNRVNLPYAYDKMNYGLDSSYGLGFWRSTVGLGYEREEIGRDFREADTEENIFKASLRSRPADNVTARISALYGDRKGKNYNSRATDASYWYTVAQAPTGVGTDRDNPLYAFANHPDLRKFDVSDRERLQIDASVTVSPLQALDLTATYGYRNDDYDSNVTSTQPLLNFLGDITQEAREASTLGIQLGLLEEQRQNYGIDAYYAPVERWHLSAFVNREEIDSEIRGMVFNENRRENLNEINLALTNLGRWDDPRYLYTVEMEDRTNTFGVGAGYELIPGKLKLSTDYVLSRGKVDWDYQGYGTEFPAPTDWETQQFGFRSPQTVKNNQYTLNASLEYQLVQNLVFGLHYLFDRYSMDDWMEEAIGEWVEQGSIAGEFFLRDTSRDNRWGNRLVNMGTPLAGSYEAHVGYATVTYRF